MISNGEKCRCLAVKRLSAILRGTTSKNNGDYYCKLSELIWGKKTNLNQMRMCGKIMPIVMQKCYDKLIEYQRIFKNKNLPKHYFLFIQIWNPCLKK